MRRRGEKALAALAAGAVLLLSACTGAPETAPPSALAPAQAAAPALAQLKAAPLDPDGPLGAGPTPELVGLTGADVSRLLGAPTLLRREPPAEVWQYANAACVLHVFIYQEKSGSRVVYYETTPSAGRRLLARDCYDRVLARRRAES